MKKRPIRERIAFWLIRRKIHQSVKMLKEKQKNISAYMLTLFEEFVLVPTFEREGFVIAMQRLNVFLASKWRPEQVVVDMTEKPPLDQQANDVLNDGKEEEP